MRKIIISTLTIIILFVVGYYTLSETKDMGVLKRETIVKNLTKNEFSKVMASWKIDPNNSLFVKDVNVDQMNKFFETIKETYGACKIEKEPKCTSHERVENMKDKHATEFGSSITCSYELTCEKKTTKGSLIFKPVGKNTYQIGRFSMELD